VNATSGVVGTDFRHLVALPRDREVIQTVEFVPGSCDIHDVSVYNGQLYGVDAGEHPGWSIDNPAYQHPGFPPLNSPSGGYIFRIDLI